MSTQFSELQLVGLVVAYFGGSIEVASCEGEPMPIQCRLRRNQALPIVGDYVVYQKDTETTGFVISILPRCSELAKADYYGRRKVLVANIDYILVVMAPYPAISTYLVDRYLAAAELQGITSLIVVNKIDLAENKTEIELLLHQYQAIGYQTILTSVKTKEGVQALKELMCHKKAVLVGPSGVGKSSIINAVCDMESIRVGEVSKKGTGKHTTTATRLYPIPGGGSLLDSPGVREFNLYPVDPKQMLVGFREFMAYAKACKYRDCSHGVEPDCAIREAVQANKISADRYEHFQTLQREMMMRYKNENKYDNK